MIDKKFLSGYEPNTVENAIYTKWTESGLFNPDTCISEGVCEKDAETFSIVLPPPNVTGVLHIGHAYEDALQDVIVRFNRMRGKKTLWIPGTDSAAIATQARVEKTIRNKEKKSRHDLGREELVRRVSEFAKNSEDTILSQIKKMGASLDWSRYAYTLDEKRNLAVATAFKRMYDAGLIYRGNRIVNWDPKGQTTVSDDEVVHEATTGKLYTFKYSKDFPIAIATTRPETKIGDTGVAVHPDDKRYAEYIGQTFSLEFCGVPLEIKIIGDSAVDPEFGTGAVGVTPAHSMTDWEIANRHNLPIKQVIDEYAKMSVDNTSLRGLKTHEARDYIVDWLKEHDLLEKEEDVEQNKSISERTGALIEPLPKLQWWIDVNKPFVIPYSEIPGIESGSETTLKELMRQSVKSSAINMPQERFRKIYFHWIDNLRDWCISRQIWFGHRIPVWYKGDEIYCDTTEPEGAEWVQEEDVLDTWFSSALWTFSTLGWPEETNDLKTFHPTSLISPAYEILPLWVSRMILMSGFHLGQIPFKTVLIHGLVRASDGRKFSKSLGNGVDPLDLVESYGSDAVRMGLITGTPVGSDITFDENAIRGYRKFSNKLWNITRFILENTEEAPEKQPTLSETDMKLVSELDEIILDVTKDIEEFRFHIASEKLYHYAWHRLADEIIEESKDILNGDESPEKNSRQWTLLHILATIVKGLHPFMPFVTEEIWSSLPVEKSHELLMVNKWPKPSQSTQ